MKRLMVTTVIVGVLIGTSAIASAREPLATRIWATGIPLEEARSFFQALQEAVRSDDARAVSGLCQVPLSVSRDGKKKKYKKASALEKDYHEIFCPQMRELVLTQEFEDLFANWRGLAVGAGEIWFSTVCETKKCVQSDLKIIAISCTCADDEL